MGLNYFIKHLNQFIWFWATQYSCVFEIWLVMFDFWTVFAMTCFFVILFTQDTMNDTRIQTRDSTNMIKISLEKLKSCHVLIWQDFELLGSTDTCGTNIILYISSPHTYIHMYISPFSQNSQKLYVIWAWII